MRLISFIIPCYRSEKTLPAVIAEIGDSMSDMADKGNPCDYEIILINDCSPDNTIDTIRRICAENDRVSAINLARNFGQHAAIMAGLRYSTGDIAVCLDDDGQTPASEVYKLLDKLDDGFDVVYAKYSNKKHSLFRNFGSVVNERMTRIMLKKPKDLYISSYFAAKRFVVNDMLKYEHSYPYVIGLVLRATGSVANVDVEHRERTEGSSGYTLGKLLSLWFNGFTAFSIIPLRVATIIGTIFAIMGFIYGVFVIIKRLVDPSVPMGFSSTMAAQVFIGGMIMVMLGLIGEYIGRIYISLNNSPQYVVKEEIGKKFAKTEPPK